MFRLGKPVVAAVNGHAVAGGAILVCAYDQRLMSAGRIGVSEAYRHTKHRFHRDTEERIARWGPEGDAEAERLWTTAVTDGRIARFMQKVAGRAR